MFAVTLEDGMCMAFPDVCQVPAPPAPPIPTPFPNIAMPMMGDPAALNVFIVGMPALHLNSEIPLTDGDQAGLAGGVLCGEIMGPAKFLMGSMVVMLEGNPGVRLSSPTLQNEDNAPGIVMMPSQPTVLLLA